MIGCRFRFGMAPLNRFGVCASMPCALDWPWFVVGHSNAEVRLIVPEVGVSNASEAIRSPLRVFWFPDADAAVRRISAAAACVDAAASEPSPGTATERLVVVRVASAKSGSALAGIFDSSCMSASMPSQSTRIFALFYNIE